MRGWETEWEKKQTMITFVMFYLCFCYVLWHFIAEIITFSRGDNNGSEPAKAQTESFQDSTGYSKFSPTRSL